MKKLKYITILSFVLIPISYLIYLYSSEFYTKKTEMNEVLEIFRKFERINQIYGSPSYSTDEGYHISYDDSLLKKNYTLSQVDSFVLEIEGVEKITSKLYLNDFIESVSYDKSKDELLLFLETDFYVFNEGKWHQIYSRYGGER